MSYYMLFQQSRFHKLIKGTYLSGLRTGRQMQFPIAFLSPPSWPDRETQKERRGVQRTGDDRIQGDPRLRAAGGVCCVQPIYRLTGRGRNRPLPLPTGCLVVPLIWIAFPTATQSLPKEAAASRQGPYVLQNHRDDQLSSYSITRHIAGPATDLRLLSCARHCGGNPQTKTLKGHGWILAVRTQRFRYHWLFHTVDGQNPAPL